MGVIIYCIKRNVVEWASCTLTGPEVAHVSLGSLEPAKRSTEGIYVSFLDSLQHGTNLSLSTLHPLVIQSCLKFKAKSCFTPLHQEHH